MMLNLDSCKMKKNSKKKFVYWPVYTKNILHRMAIGQNGFLYNTIQHSHTSDAERMEIGFRQD